MHAKVQNEHNVSKIQQLLKHQHRRRHSVLLRQQMGRGAAISSESCLELSCTDCTVLFENKTTLFAVYRKKAELFSTPQLIVKCTHTKLLAGPSFDEGSSFRCFGPPT